MIYSRDRNEIFYIIKPSEAWKLAAIIIGSITAVIVVIFMIYAALYTKEIFSEQMRKDMEAELIQKARNYVYIAGDEEVILGESA